jgi:hypothetical protein
MKSTNSFKFSVVFLEGQKESHGFKGDFVTEKAVNVMPHKKGENCFAYINEKVHFIVRRDEIDGVDIINDIYTVSNPEKIHQILVTFDKNNVKVPATFPVGTQFTLLKVAEVYSFGPGGLFLSTEPV